MQTNDFKILSTVPASGQDFILDEPFKFTLQGQPFEIKPLSLADYIFLERKLNTSLAALVYYRTAYDQELQTMLSMENCDLKTVLDRSESLVEILCRILTPISEGDLAGLIVQHNQIFGLIADKSIDPESDYSTRLKAWLDHHLALPYLIDVASHFLRYCAEFKKKLFIIVERGWASASTSTTNDESETKSASSPLDRVLDSLEIGPYRYN